VTLEPDAKVTDADIQQAVGKIEWKLQWFDTAGRPLRRVGYHLLWLWPRPAGSTSGFSVPTDVAVDRNGVIHVADSGNHRVVMLSPEGEYLTEWRVPAANPNV
jgi:hypothetical protein